MVNRSIILSSSEIDCRNSINQVFGSDLSEQPMVEVEYQQITVRKGTVSSSSPEFSSCQKGGGDSAVAFCFTLDAVSSLESTLRRNACFENLYTSLQVATKRKQHLYLHRGDSLTFQFFFFVHAAR
jgi:hypothetical protein